MTDENERLRAWFADLRRADEGRAPAFRAMWARAAAGATSRARMRFRRWVVAAAVAVAGALMLTIRARPPADFPSLAIPVGGPLPLDGLLTMPVASALHPMPELDLGASSTWSAVNGDMTWH